MGVLLAYMSVYLLKGQKMVADDLELKLQTVLKPCGCWD